MSESDRDLREQFTALRRETAMGVPSFRSTMTRVSQRRRSASRLRRPSAWILGASGAAAAVAVSALAVAHLGSPRKTLVDLGVVRWEAPTDFLLRTPGAELLRTMPAITTDRRLLP